MKRANHAFTFAEILVAMGVLGIVILSGLTFYIWQHRTWQTLDLNMRAAHLAHMAVSQMVYGAGGRRGLRTATDVSLVTSGDDWTLQYRTPTETNRFEYLSATRRLVLNPGQIEIGRGLFETTVTNVNAQTWRIEVTAEQAGGRHTATHTTRTTVRHRN